MGTQSVVFCPKGIIFNTVEMPSGPNIYKRMLNLLQALTYFYYCLIDLQSPDKHLMKNYLFVCTTDKNCTINYSQLVGIERH